MPVFLEAVAGGLVKLGVKVVGNQIGFGVAGDLVVGAWDAIWESWNKDRPEENEKREDVLETIQASPTQHAQRVKQITRLVAGTQLQGLRETVAEVLQQIPSKIRQSFKRPDDFTGTTIPPYLRLQKAEDLVSLLPDRLSRFKVGQSIPGRDLRLTELLGIGGFGEVWMARNPHFDGMPPVALKFCLDPAAKNLMLKYEAKVLNRVMRVGKHPGIVELRGTSLDFDPPFLEYEYVNGGELTSWIQEWGSLPNQWKEGHPYIFRPRPIEIAQIIGKLAWTVGCIHGLNPPIIHRDLKPANILIEGTREEYRLRITDFGIGGIAAKATVDTSRKQNPSIIRASMLSGAYTPLYAPPQQMRGDPPDPRDDVFSLGVIWYQMMTCDLTKGAPTGRGWIGRMLDLGMTQPFIDLLADCVSDDSEDRPQNGTDLTNKIAHLLESRSAQDHFDEGCILWERKDAEEAIDEFTESIKLTPDNALAFLARGRAFAFCVILNPLDNQFTQSMRDKAIVDFSEAIRLNPTLIEAIIERAELYGQIVENETDTSRISRFWESAIADYGKAIELCPTDAALFLKRGEMFLYFSLWFEGVADKECEGIADLERAIALQPSENSFRFRLANYYDGSFDDRAIAVYRDILEIDPSNKQAKDALVDFYWNNASSCCSEGRYLEAIASYHHCLEFDSNFPDNPDPLLVLAECYLKAGQYANGVDVISTLLEDLNGANHPGHAANHVKQCGDLYWEFGLYELAAKSYADAVRLDHDRLTELAEDHNSLRKLYYLCLHEPSVTEYYSALENHEVLKDSQHELHAAFADALGAAVLVNYELKSIFRLHKPTLRFPPWNSAVSALLENPESHLKDLQSWLATSKTPATLEWLRSSMADRFRRGNYDHFAVLFSLWTQTIATQSAGSETSSVSQEEP